MIDIDKWYLDVGVEKTDRFNLFSEHRDIKYDGTCVGILDRGNLCHHADSSNDEIYDDYKLTTGLNFSLPLELNDPPIFMNSNGKLYTKDINNTHE